MPMGVWKTLTQKCVCGGGGGGRRVLGAGDFSARYVYNDLAPMQDFGSKLGEGGGGEGVLSPLWAFTQHFMTSAMLVPIYINFKS